MALSERQIADWMRYAEAEPFGPPADDWRTAILSYWSVPKGKKSTLTIADFLPKWQSQADQTSIVRPLSYQEKSMLRMRWCAARMESNV